MQAARTKAHVSRYVSEDETYWQNQLSSFRASGLTRKGYCRQNGINYDRFTYWMGKHITQQTQVTSKQFLQVKLKPELEKSESGSLFSLILKNGCILQIHNEQALSIILEKMV
jgi:hypothetical protein